MTWGLNISVSDKAQVSILSGGLTSSSDKCLLSELNSTDFFPLYSAFGLDIKHLTDCWIQSQQMEIVLANVFNIFKNNSKHFEFTVSASSGKLGRWDEAFANQMAWLYCFYDEKLYSALGIFLLSREMLE